MIKEIIYSGKEYNKEVWQTNVCSLKRNKKDVEDCSMIELSGSIVRPHNLHSYMS